MKLVTKRRNFLKGLAGLSAFAVGGRTCPFGRQKIRLAVVGVMGKGYSDWLPMLQSGLVEIVAFCDCDYGMRERAQQQLANDGVDFDMFRIPFYTDYRRMLDDAGMLGVDAMTVSTPDHTHAPVAIRAMKQGIHVYVQKPLVRTLWELDYFERTARENGVVTQMGNQGSALDMLRRGAEVIQAGVIGEVGEAHVWTNRPVWPQGQNVAAWVKNHPKGDPLRKGLNWDAWLNTAAERPFLDKYPDDADVYDPWNLGKNVYHTFTWRGFHDFGCGAFGDMACHTMNLAFRGLELADVTSAECTTIESKNDIAYPLKSVVRLVYAARESKARPGVRLPEVRLTWYDGGSKPDPELMRKWTDGNKENIPDTGCFLVGSKGALLMPDSYGAAPALALADDKKFTFLPDHEAVKTFPRVIPYRAGPMGTGDKASVQMKGFALGHYLEFLDAIRGEGKLYEATHSRCFSDIEYSIPQMEGILVGCVAQQVAGKLKWCSCKQSFDNQAANALVKPFIRKGWEF